MFCPGCGSELEDGAKFCANCGRKVTSTVDDVVNDVKHGFDKAETQLESAVADVRNTYENVGKQQVYAEHLQSDRSLVAYILLSIITCGIYSYYFIYKMAHDINIACDGDGKKTGGLVAFIVLSFITCGIYSWIWEYKLGNRLCTNAFRYGLSFQENGTTVLLWNIFGILICGIGPFIAMHILIKNSNAICMAYNRNHGMMF